MTMLPTRKQENWRYSNLAALKSLWPLPAPHMVSVPECTRYEKLLAPNEGGVFQLDIELERNASASIAIINMHGAYGRIEINARLMRGSQFNLKAVILGHEDQTLEIITHVHHIEGDATSEQIVRSLLANNATGSYLGKIEVAPDAQKTSASQSSKAMVLHRTATVNTKPELIIHADDVKCAHGATVGEMDAQALFYMAARGIDPAMAKVLLTQAFLKEAILDAQEELPATISAWLAAQFAKDI